MKLDPIVEEVRLNRAKILESYGWDFEKMCHGLMKKYGSDTRAPRRAKSSMLRERSPRYSVKKQSGL